MAIRSLILAFYKNIYFSLQYVVCHEAFFIFSEKEIFQQISIYLKV